MPTERRASPAILTIVSNNYLHFACTMLRSAKEHHPDYTMYCVIVDRDRSHAEALRHEFEPIWIDDLQLPLGDEFLFQYTILELNTAVKPWAIQYLLDRGHDTIIYVDPDVFFYHRMVHVEEMLSAGMDLVLTPHLLAPVDDYERPTELDIRRSGTYNLGFCGLRDTRNTRAFLSWWQAKLTRGCVSDVSLGVFVDQSWVDLVPGLFEHVGILRHPGYNVAYWNLAQRMLSPAENGGHSVGRDPLVFFHFSGLNLEDLEEFSVHQSRFTLSTVGLVKGLVGAYVSIVRANGYTRYRELPYDFGRFSDGEKCPDVFRALYRRSSALRERMTSRPFSRSSVLSEPWPDISFEDVSPTNAMMAVWYSRDDLRSEFRLTSLESVVAFYRWFVSARAEEQPYSSAVIEKHLANINLFDEREQGPVRVRPGASQSVYSLYKYILHRDPDPGGFLYYEMMCGTDIGAVRAWGEIGLSEESKRKPFLWIRMIRALISVIRGMRRDARTMPIPPHALGLFAEEADAATNGVWVSDRVVLPIPARGRERVSLTGTYFPELIEKQHGSGENILRVRIGKHEIHAATLTANGDFVIECRLPPSRRLAAKALTLESDRVFVPKQIGLGADERRLAWRLKELVVGDVTVFKCAPSGKMRQ